MKKGKRLSELSPGEYGEVEALLNDGGIRRRFLDIGLVPGTRVICICRSPLGDPCAYSVRGKTVAIRACDAEYVCLRRCPCNEKG